jgi:hypothetical protein
MTKTAKSVKSVFPIETQSSRSNKRKEQSAPNVVIEPGVLDYHESSFWRNKPNQLDMNDWSEPRKMQRLLETIDQKIVENVKGKIVDERSKCTIRFGMSAFTEFVELNLAYHALLKYGCQVLKKIGDEPSGKDAILMKTNVLELQSVAELLRASYKYGLIRLDSPNILWCLQKILEIAHFILDILNYGPSGGYNTDTGERGLKIWGKKPAETAQKRSDTVFKKQVARNSVEMRILKLLGTEEEPGSFPDEDENDVGFSTSASYDNTYVYWRKNRKGIEIKNGIYKKVGRRLVQNSNALFPEQVQLWFSNHFPLQGAEDEIFVQIFTQLTITKNGEDTIVRAHPNYGGNGAWFDYVGIYYDQAECDLPARCACFFYEPEREEEQESDNAEASSECAEASNTTEKRIGGERYMLVQECYYPTAAERRQSEQSLLFEDFRLQGVESGHNEDRIVACLTCRDCKSIQNRLFCIDPEPNNGGAFWKSVVEKRTEHNIFKIVLIRERRTEWVERLLRRIRGMLGIKDDSNDK